jgi:chromosome segregation ATPase
MENAPKTDQKDMIAALTTERDEARNNLNTANGTIASLTKERDESRTALASVTTERDTLRTQNADLQNQMTDFNKRVAAEVAKAGINSTSTTAPASAEPKAKTLTERCLEAKKKDCKKQ